MTLNPRLEPKGKLAKSPRFSFHNYVHPQELSLVFVKISAASLQMDRSRSSGGVGWSNGYWGIVTSKRTPRLARLEVRRKSLNMISSLCFFFFVFSSRLPGIWSSPIEIL